MLSVISPAATVGKTLTSKKIYTLYWPLAVFAPTKYSLAIMDSNIVSSSQTALQYHKAGPKN